MEETIIKYIGNFGVPAILLFYQMFTLNKSIKELTASVNKLKDPSDQLNHIENTVISIDSILKDRKGIA